MPQRKKNKAGKNGFYFFMLEVQKQEKQKGTNYNLNQISEIASPLWSAMSLDQRKRYNDMAAASTNKSNEDMTKKYTSLGISYAELDAEQREMEEARNLMFATVKNTIASLDRQTGLKKHVFFVCHVNYFYKMDNFNYYPAEVGMAAFSLEHGVISTLQFFVDPDILPLGYKFEIVDWASRTHKIPVYDESWKEGIKEFIEMYRRVRDFLRKFTSGNEEVPPIYAMYDPVQSNSRHTVVKSALNMMCDAANEDPSLFRVFDLSLLFYEIRNKCSPEIPSIAIMKHELDRDVFQYARGMGCYFHEEQDFSIHCSLSTVTRWVFTICDHCCKHLGIELVLGRHVPRDTDLSASKRYLEDSGGAFLNEGRFNKPKPLTIIDHGYLKEQRVEERRALDAQLQESEKIRLPKSNYSRKIGAQFNQDTVPRSSQSSSERREQAPDEDGWLTVRSNKPAGRGRGIFTDTSPEQPVWPVSGRGRAFSKQKF